MKLYVMRSVAGLVKVGISGNPALRSRALTAEAKGPVTVAWSRRVPSGKARRIEAKVLHGLRSWHHRGEWFTCSAEVAIQAAVGAVAEEKNAPEDRPLITGAVVKCARVFADWSQQNLAQKVGSSVPTIKRIERDGISVAGWGLAQAVREAFQAVGVMLIDDDAFVGCRAVNGEGVQIQRGESADADRALFAALTEPVVSA